MNENLSQPITSEPLPDPLPQPPLFRWRDLPWLLGIILALCGSLWWSTSTATGREVTNWQEPPPVAALSLWQPSLFDDQWHPPQAAPKTCAPAPTVKRGPDRKVKGKLMATWIATLAGDATYNGTYVESGTYGGQPAYTNGSRWLWWAGSFWAMADAAGGSYDYGYTASDGSPLPATWIRGLYTSDPAPTVTEQLGEIRLGTSEADAALWDVAANHRASKYGSIGGYKDVDAGTTGVSAPSTFQYKTAGATGTYKAVLKCEGHTWAVATGLAATDGEWVAGSFADFPSSIGSDDWETWLGTAGAKALALELRKESDDSLAAEDTAAYTMFVPTLTATAPTASSTVPDRFNAVIGWVEHYASTVLAELQAVIGGDVYALRKGDVGLTCLLPASDAETVTVAVDLNQAGIRSFASFAPAGDNGLPPGAFTLRVNPSEPGGTVFDPTALTNLDVALSHVETYTVQITAPSSGAVLASDGQSLSTFITQGWWSGSLLRVAVLRGGVWTWLADSEALSDAYDGFGNPGQRMRIIPLPALDPTDTSLRVQWGYDSGEDFIVLDTDSIAITVQDPGATGGDGGDANDPGGPDYGEPPWARIDLPPAMAAVGAEFTVRVAYGNFTATADGNLRIVAQLVGDPTTAYLLYDEAAVLAGVTSALTVPVTMDVAAADGVYALVATLTGTTAPLQQALVTSPIVYAAEQAANEPPTCTITAPLTGATISGRTVTVDVTATDDRAVYRVLLYLDDALIAWTAIPRAATLYRFVLDSTYFLNGTHTLAAVAIDSDLAESDPDEISITIANTQADLTRYLYTLPLGVDAAGEPLNDASANWLNREKHRTIEVPLLPDVSGLPANQVYNVYFGYDYGAGTPTWPGMTLYDPLHSHPVSPTKILRYGWCVVPLQTQASFDITCASILRMTPAENGDPLLLCDTPHSMQRFSVAANALVQLADLTDLAETPVDLAACLGKVFVAHGAKVLVVDPDTGELTDDLDLDFRTSKTAVTALATDGAALYAAVTLTAGGSRVYRYTPEATTQVADHEHAITALAYLGATLYAGNDEGEVLTVTTAGLTLAYATGEATVARLAINSIIPYAGTGTAGKLFARLAGWGLAWDSGFTALTGISGYNGYTWAAGTGTGARYLWYEQLPGVWAQGMDTDELVTAINDLLTVADGSGHEQLFAAATRSDGTCRLYRVELAPAATRQCGVSVFPSVGKVLR